MRKTIILLFILWLPVLAAAGPTPFFTADSLKIKVQYRLVAGNWRFHPGDDKAWSRKDFNDSSWTKTDTYISLSGRQDSVIGFQGIGWFRYHFRTDSSLTGVPLGATISLWGACEVYVDDVSVQQVGVFSDSGRGRYEDLAIPFVFALKDTGEHVLAVRYEHYNVREVRRRLDVDRGGFVIALSTSGVAIEDYAGAAFIAAFFLLSSGGIFLALFVAHLILYCFYRQARSNLIFSVFNLGLAILFFFSYIKVGNRDLAVELWLAPAINVSLCLSCFALSALVNELFSKKKKRFLFIGTLCLLTAVAAFIHYAIASGMLSVLCTVCLLDAVISVIIAMRRKVRGARILSIGILFFFLFITVIITVSLINHGLHLQGGLGAMLLTVVALLALFSIPFSMSAYLAWNYAEISRDLKAQLVKVGELSARTLEQEQERQRMLETKKEELEAEVAHRTSEVLQQKRQIEQQHDALKAEKQKSDKLLLNILPVEVAEELKESGQAKARHFEHVTVLFTDFVNFTQIAEALPPEILVKELHECFRVFDEIMGRHNLEKIKTIGDAYLAVSGLPQAHPGHAHLAVSAALEILDFMTSRNSKATPFSIRIGIHSGPLVAGIVGVKKFAYDIWGDTVNTASRMESNSESGRINISGATFELIKDRFACTYRGKVSAKNKGEMDMYFVDHVITSAP